MPTFTEIKTKKHGLEFYRSPRGYFFRNWCLTILFFAKANQYSIQMRIPGVKAKWGFWKIYNGAVKPKYRNLFWLSFLFPLHFIFRALPKLVTLPLWCTGYLIFVASGLLQTIGHIFMGNRYSAARTLKNVFEVRYIGSGIKDLLK